MIATGPTATPPTAEDVPVQVVGRAFSPRRHRVMLGTCAAVVLLSFGLVVTSRGEVAPRVAPQRTLPASCVSRTWFGIGCPGCGLTRSFVQLASFRPADSVAAHPLGWLLAAYVLAQFPYRLLALRRQVHHPLGRRTAWFLANGLVALMVLVWLVRLVPNGTFARVPNGIEDVGSSEPTDPNLALDAPRSAVVSDPTTERRSDARSQLRRRS
jgi:hypothetical protein